MQLIDQQWLASPHWTQSADSGLSGTFRIGSWRVSAQQIMRLYLVHARGRAHRRWVLIKIGIQVATTSNVAGKSSMLLIRLDNDFNPLMNLQRHFRLALANAWALPMWRHCSVVKPWNSSSMHHAICDIQFPNCHSFPYRRHSNFKLWAKLKWTSLACLYLEWSLFEVIKVPENQRQHSTGWFHWLKSRFAVFTHYYQHPNWQLESFLRNDGRLIECLDCTKKLYVGW